MRVLRDIIRAGELDLIPGFPVRDSSGAILVDVELQDGSTLSEFLIQEGLAMTEPADFDALSNARVARLTRSQSQARRTRIGLWGRR
jgi:endonuclease YncB( thermonuclease family)